MIVDKSSIAIGSNIMKSLSVADAIVIGSRDKALTDTIFIQNDSNTNPASLWYINQVDATHYAMLNATAPKGWQYLGAFLVDGKSGVRGGRADGAVWTISNPSMVQHITTSAAGQAAVSILSAGTCVLTVTLRDMVSTLVITAVDAS